ncbi:MAG: diguanylate cyclase [Burkholderiaceae bacterium]
MNIDSASEFAAKLKVLRAQYLSKLDLTLDDLNRHVLGLGPDVARPTLQSLHAKLHKLSGSGATFGLPELSRQARSLEQTAQKWLDAKQAFDPEAWQQWVSEVLGLRLLIHWQEEAPDLTLPHDLSINPKPRGTKVALVQGKPLPMQEMAQALETFGYSVSTFPDLTTAQAALLQTPPDVLLVAMSDQAADNEQLTRTLDQLFSQLGRRLPTIFLAPQDSYSFQLAAARAQVEYCLSLPLDTPALAGHIETLLQEGEPPMRILIVDDDEDLAEHYRLILIAAGMQAQRLSEPTEVMAALDQFNPDVLLLDLDMPEVSGAELARIIRYQERWKGLAITYLSAQTDVMRQVRAMKSGVDEFLVKPISDLQLVASLLSRALRSRKLAALMNQDSLTGLLKHNGIKDRLAQEFDRAKRQGKPMSAAMIDIDFFKKVNDSWGHPMGDQVIKTLANLMRQRLRRQDSLGRYGGEEFLVILPECAAADAQKLLDDLRQHFAQLEFHTGSTSFRVTMSAGVACSTLLADGPSMVAAADQALYQAKHGGRNQVCVASAPT